MLTRLLQIAAAAFRATLPQQGTVQAQTARPLYAWENGTNYDTPSFLRRR